MFLGLYEFYGLREATLACLETVNTAGADMHTHPPRCHGYCLVTQFILRYYLVRTAAR